MENLQAMLEKLKEDFEAFKQRTMEFSVDLAIGLDEDFSQLRQVDLLSLEAFKEIDKKLNEIQELLDENNERFVRIEQELDEVVNRVDKLEQRVMELEFK